MLVLYFCKNPMQFNIHTVKLPKTLIPAPVCSSPPVLVCDMCYCNEGQISHIDLSFNVSSIVKNFHIQNVQKCLKWLEMDEN